MSIPLLDQTTEEKVVTVANVSWEQFKVIETQLKDNHNVRLSYLSGILEIMSPIGEKHEEVKSTLGLLIEAYMRENNIRFYKRGGYTLEAPGYASGTPDESYSIGTRGEPARSCCSNKEGLANPEGEVPDIVIEIIVSSGTINRKELYKPKRIPEVWFWKSNQMQIFRLNEQGEYEEVSRSGFFPDLDLALLLRYIAKPDQYNAVAEFIQAIAK